MWFNMEMFKACPIDYDHPPPPIQGSVRYALPRFPLVLEEAAALEVTFNDLTYL